MINSKEINEYDFGTREEIHSQGMEANLYLRDNIVYKFLLEKYRFNRDTVLMGLYKDRVKNTPIPLELLTTSGLFVGYSMPYLSDYYLVRDYVYIADYDYSLRRKACLDLIVSLNDMISKGYEHYDLQSKNVMVKDGSARIIDIDSMCNPSLGVPLHNSSYAIYDLEDRKVNSDMKKGIAFIISRLLLVSRDYLVDDLGRESIIKEFNNDEVMKSILSGNSRRLIDIGYSTEDVLDSITEEKTNKYFELRKSLK